MTQTQGKWWNVFSSDYTIYIKEWADNTEVTTEALLAIYKRASKTHWDNDGKLTTANKAAFCVGWENTDENKGWPERFWNIMNEFWLWFLRKICGVVAWWSLRNDPLVINIWKIPSCSPPVVATLKAAWYLILSHYHQMNRPVHHHLSPKGLCSGRSETHQKWRQHLISSAADT